MSKESRSEERKSGERRSSRSSRDGKAPRAERVVTRNLSVTAIHRRLLGLSVMATIVAVTVCIVAASIASRRVPPQYVPVQEDGRLMPVSSLSKANMDDVAISAYALEAVKALNTYDYINWRDQINAAAMYFTPKAWGDYKAEVDRTGTMRAVEDRKHIVSFRPNGPVVVVKQGTEADNLYTWDVEVPAVISYVSHQQAGTNNNTGSNRQEGVVRLRIKRISSSLVRSGVAISAYGYILTK